LSTAASAGEQFAMERAYIYHAHRPRRLQHNVCNLYQPHPSCMCCGLPMLLRETKHNHGAAATGCGSCSWTSAFPPLCCSPPVSKPSSCVSSVAEPRACCTDESVRLGSTLSRSTSRAPCSKPCKACPKECLIQWLSESLGISSHGSQHSSPSGRSPRVNTLAL
jgi:hypothetical protein